jgi:hypothetical protein
MALGSKKGPRQSVSLLDRRLAGPTTRDRSDRQETAAAADYGGRKKGGSGASPYSKGDVAIKHADLLMECKTTDHASYRLEFSTLAKITKEALGEGKDPAIEIEIMGGQDPVCERRWVAVPSSVFKKLIGE